MFGYGSCTNHQKPVSTFQKFHFPFYPISHRTWCTPFVHQLPPYRRYQKIADGWCNTHIKTRATIKLFHIQPHHSAHSLATHPSGKLVNYKRLACYEHCPGTFGYTFVYCLGLTYWWHYRINHRYNMSVVLNLWVVNILLKPVDL